MARSRDERRYLTWVYQRRQIGIHDWSFVTTELTPRGRGRLRTLAYCDCGNPRCGLCGNPRRSKTSRGRGYPVLTLQEKKQLENFKDQIDSI